MAEQIGQVALRAEAALQGQSTKDLRTSEIEHKRAFLETFRRWEVLFKRRDSGDVAAEKWLIAEYYDSLRHLSPRGMDALTKLLKENCTFFPSIRECLELIRPKDRYDWGHPFLNKPQMFNAQPSSAALGYDRTKKLTGPSDE